MDAARVVTSIFRDFGFHDFKDEDDYHGAASGWHSNDLAFFEQTADRLVGLPRPFFAYLITMQSHGPFDNVTDRSRGLPVAGVTADEATYLRSMHEVDLAIGRLMERLEQAGLLAHTVVMVFGDHASGLDRAADFDLDDSGGIPEHTSLFVRLPSGESRMDPKIGSQIDLAPTVADLFGLRGPHEWLGTSLLAPGGGCVVLNYPTPVVLRNGPDGGLIRVRDVDPYRRYVRWSEAVQR